MSNGSCFLAVRGAHFDRGRRVVVPTRPRQPGPLMTKATPDGRLGIDCTHITRWPIVAFGSLYDMLGSILFMNKPTNRAPSASPSKTSAAPRRPQILLLFYRVERLCNSSRGQRARSPRKTRYWSLKKSTAGPIRIRVPALDLPGTEQFIGVLISHPIGILLGQTK